MSTTTSTTTMVKGLFMKEFSWAHPDFAPWNLANLNLNKAQRDALLDEDIDEICSPNLTTEQKIELCRTIPCRVELFHSNVCKGVERSWPKRMFKKANFDLLTPKEKRRLYRGMQAKAVLLYNEYVCAIRLANRRRRRTSRALAPYYEKQYRKNLFQRLVAIDKPAPGYDAIIDDAVEFADNEDESTQSSLETVINTEKTGTQKSNMDADTNMDAEQIDANDNDCSSDVMSENAEHRSGLRSSNNWKSISMYTITRNYEVQPIDSPSDNGLIGSECNVQTTEDEYNVELSEAASSTTNDTNLETQSQDHQNACFARDEMLADEVVFATPLRYRQSRNDLVDYDDLGANSEDEVDSLDFLSQVLPTAARTSTQQSNQ